MEVISSTEFGGERPLFESHNLRLENVVIRAGESAIKECSNIEAVDCRFEGNYPFWHVHGFVIDRCFFDVGGRSALWYSDHLKMTNTRIDAPKMFREMHDIEIENVEINDADEVFWRCQNLDIKNLKLHGGTYPFMFSSNIRIDGLESDSKYVFQYVKNVEIHNAKITTKDAFWEVENDNLRFGTQRRILGLAFAQSPVGELSHHRRTAALLCPRPRVGDLHVRSRLRPGFRVQFGAGHHPRRDRRSKESANRLYHRREL